MRQWPVRAVDWKLPEGPGSSRAEFRLLSEEKALIRTSSHTAVAAGAGLHCHCPHPSLPSMARLIVHNAKITTLASAHPTATALAVGSDGNFAYVGEDTPALWALKGPATKVIDLQGRRLLPGLNDSHLHILRAALWYNGELRWDGVTSLKRGLEMLAEQAKRTPEGQRVRVVGGWTHYQFAEKVPCLVHTRAHTR